MKRSEINAALREMEAMIREYRFALPDFCHFTPEDLPGDGDRAMIDEIFAEEIRAFDRKYD